MTTPEHLKLKLLDVIKIVATATTALMQISNILTVC